MEITNREAISDNFKKFRLGKGIVLLEDINNIPLVASEISGLWNAYESESIAKCIFSYFLKHVDDKETKGILEDCFEKTKLHMEIITGIFNKSGLPIPDGYSDKDVNLNAPRLFTDSFYLAYLSYLARVGMHNYTLILNHISRPDIVDYFSDRIKDSIELYKESARLRLSKGIFIKAPRVEIVKEVQYIKSKEFMMDTFGEKRPLILKEITNLFSVILANIIGGAIVTAFTQVSKNKELFEYFNEGSKLATKKIGALTSLFLEEGIPIPSTYDSFVTDSTTAPFSEKLMISHVLVLTSTSIAQSGMALSGNIRADLQALFLKFLSTDLKYGHKGAKIAIENGWMEQPPQAIRHEKLAEF